ncbi:MAG: hypothetical protein OEZ57_03860 [Nitrospirota bacterium]|nr:hypothetical protein [Nitrospirota bacterium]MDH5774034.1 hypothetical protein [Nitrospirota bacterium]
MPVLVRPIADDLQSSPTMENLPENSTSSEETLPPVDKTVKPKPGLRLELRGSGNYYKGILHIGSTFIPISDDILEELQTKTALSPDGFFRLFVEKVGYSSYLTEQIHQEVKNAGNLNAQMSAIQQILRQGLPS